MPVIACPHCRTKLNGPDSVLGKEVICGQCHQRFIAAAEAPFGSRHARPEPPGASREAGSEFMEPLTPGPAHEPGPAPQPAAEPLNQGAQPAQWQAPGQQERAAPPPPRPAGPTWSPTPFSGGPSQPAGAPQAPPPVPPQGGTYGPAPMPGQPYGPYAPAWDGTGGGTLPPASGAAAAHTLGIISIFGGCCCGIAGLVCGILAIILAGNAIREIDSGRANPMDRGKANTGRICGIIGLILSLLGIVFGIISVLLDGGHWNMGNSTF